MSDHEHESSLMTYTLVFVGLMILLVASVVTSGLNWGPWNLVVAMAISLGKTLLVVLFFMHVLHSSNLTRIMAASGVLWLVFLVALTLSDYQTRGWLSPSELKEEVQTLDRMEDEYLDRDPGPNLD